MINSLRAIILHLQIVLVESRGAESSEPRLRAIHEGRESNKSSFVTGTHHGVARRLERSQKFRTTMTNMWLK